MFHARCAGRIIPRIRPILLCRAILGEPHLDAAILIRMDFFALRASDDCQLRAGRLVDRNFIRKASLSID
ncbi:hypothetical protein D3C80_342470 [compost metagenome]